MPVDIGVDSLIAAVSKRVASGFRDRVESLLTKAFHSTQTEFGVGATASSEASSLASGQLIEFAGVSIPQGFLECNGSEVSRTQYSDLYAAIGNTYGSASSGKFRLPDLRGAAVTGAGGTRVAGQATTVGAVHASDTVTLTEQNLPAHTHGVDQESAEAGGHTHTWEVMPNVDFNSGERGDSVSSEWNIPGVGYGLADDDAGTEVAGLHTHAVGGNVTSAGGGVAMPVQQPSLTVTMLIKT